MGAIELYIVFCLTTGIVGAIQVYRFVHNKLEESHVNNIVTQAPIKAYLLFTLFGTITAPALIWVLLIPSITETFINSMYESIIS